jgi:hypothetical protein
LLLPCLKISADLIRGCADLLKGSVHGCAIWSSGDVDGLENPAADPTKGYHVAQGLNVVFVEDGCCRTLDCIQTVET